VDRPVGGGDVEQAVEHVLKQSRLLAEGRGELPGIGLFGLDEAAFRRIAARHVRLADDPYLVLGLERSADPADLKASAVAMWNRPSSTSSSRAGSSPKVAASCPA
jgi:hypothetical protein